jgi:hypothetical protein
MLENDTEGVQRHWINALLAWHTDECMHAGTESETRQADLLTGKDHDNIVRKPGRNICALLFFLSGQQSFLCCPDKIVSCPDKKNKRAQMSLPGFRNIMIGFRRLKDLTLES